MTKMIDPSADPATKQQLLAVILRRELEAATGEDDLRERLRAALSLPTPTVEASVVQRERALVHEALKQSRMADMDEALPEGGSPAWCHNVIAAINRVHPRAPDAAALAYERAAKVCEERAEEQRASDRAAPLMGIVRGALLGAAARIRALPGPSPAAEVIRPGPRDIEHHIAEEREERDVEAWLADFLAAYDADEAYPVRKALARIGPPPESARVGLQVIATCGECKHCAPVSVPPRPACVHPETLRVHAIGYVPVDADATPPSNCPLRGGRRGE